MAVSGKIRGGDITQFVYDGREFDIDSEANITYRLSGKTVENKMNGNGKKYTLVKVKFGGLDSVVIILDQSKKDLEFLQDHSDGEDYPLQITMASGAIYSGDSAIEGDIDATTGDGNAEIGFASEQFEQI